MISRSELSKFLSKNSNIIIREILKNAPQHSLAHLITNSVFTGKYNCGLSCDITRKILQEKLDIECLVKRSLHMEFVGDDYTYDHCYLTIPNSDLLIDTSYRQFFDVDDLPSEPIFLGNLEELYNLLETHNGVNTNTHLFWRQDMDITHLFKKKNIY